MYTHIVNPKTGVKVSIQTQLGKKIIQKLDLGAEQYQYIIYLYSYIQTPHPPHSFPPSQLSSPICLVQCYITLSIMYSMIIVS